jgi:hypothetical protein
MTRGLERFPFRCNQISKKMSWRPERRARVAGAAKLRTKITFEKHEAIRARSGATLCIRHENKRWLDFARHDSLMCRDIPTLKPP